MSSSSNAACTRIKRRALVPFSAAQMYQLVADIDAYPQFLPWCRAAKIHSADEQAVTASLTIAKGPLRKSFTTKNLLHAPDRIEMSLIDGPFRHLQGAWLFEELGKDGSRVTLEMEFEIAGSLLRRTLEPIFSEIGNTMVDAFCKRARELYAP